MKLLNTSTAVSILVLFSFSAMAVEYCPVDKPYPANLDCVCPPGSTPSLLEGCLGDACYKSCDSTGATPVNGCPVEKDLATNFKWLHLDSIHGGEAAAMRKNILRASSITALGDVVRIRKSYKEGQSHNSSAADLIDQCDDDHVRNIAYRFAEDVVRLKTCNAQPPASSATCGDVVENLRWSVVDSASCAPFARAWLTQAMDTSQILKVRAEHVRRAIMVAHGHDQSIADSVDFISDSLLVRIGEKVYSEQNVSSLDRRTGDSSNPFTVQACPGINLFKKYQ